MRSTHRATHDTTQHGTAPPRVHSPFAQSFPPHTRSVFSWVQMQDPKRNTSPTTQSALGFGVCESRDLQGVGVAGRGGRGSTDFDRIQMPSQRVSVKVEVLRIQGTQLLQLRNLKRLRKDIRKWRIDIPSARSHPRSSTQSQARSLPIGPCCQAGHVARGSEERRFGKRTIESRRLRSVYTRRGNAGPAGVRGRTNPWAPEKFTWEGAEVPWSPCSNPTSPLRRASSLFSIFSLIPYIT